MTPGDLDVPLETIVAVDASAHMAGRYDWARWVRKSTSAEPGRVRLEAGLDVGAEVGSEAFAWTVLFGLAKGVQEDGSSRDGARGEDDVRLAAPQGEWTARGMQDVRVCGAVCRLGFEALNHHVRGNHERFTGWWILPRKTILPFVD